MTEVKEDTQEPQANLDWTEHLALLEARASRVSLATQVFRGSQGRRASLAKMERTACRAHRAAKANVVILDPRDRMVNQDSPALQERLVRMEQMDSRGVKDSLALLGRTVHLASLVLEGLPAKMASPDVQGLRANPEGRGSLAWTASRVVRGSLAPEDNLGKMDKMVSLAHPDSPAPKGFQVSLDNPGLLAKLARTDNLVQRALLVSLVPWDSPGLLEGLVQEVNLALKEDRAKMDNLDRRVCRASRVVQGSLVRLAFLAKLDSLGPQGNLGKTEAMDSQVRQGRMGTLACQAHLVEMVQWVKQGCQVFQALLANRQPQRSAIIPPRKLNITILENSWL